MPAQVAELDWPGLRTAAIALGNVQAAALAATRHLHPDEANRIRERINKRAYRERWLADPRKDTAKTALVQYVPPTVQEAVQTVQTGADALLAINADHSRRGRAALLRYGAEKAEHAASLPDEAGLAAAPLVASLAKTLSVAGDWSAAQGSGTQTIVNIALLGRVLDPVVEATVERISDGVEQA